MGTRSSLLPLALALWLLALALWLLTLTLWRLTLTLWLLRLRWNLLGHLLWLTWSILRAPLQRWRLLSLWLFRPSQTKQGGLLLLLRLRLSRLSRRCLARGFALKEFRHGALLRLRGAVVHRIGLLRRTTHAVLAAHVLLAGRRKRPRGIRRRTRLVPWNRRQSSQLARGRCTGSLRALLRADKANRLLGW